MGHQSRSNLTRGYQISHSRSHQTTLDAQWLSREFGLVQATELVDDSNERFFQGDRVTGKDQSKIRVLLLECPKQKFEK